MTTETVMSGVSLDGFTATLTEGVTHLPYDVRRT